MIAWLADKANLPESNGRVGIISSSYEGHTVVMALLRPHPALKVAAAESPMIDQWRDDWFHNGAFHNIYLDYFAMQTGAKGALPRPAHHGFWATKQDYRAATITLERGGSEGSRVWLPVLPIDASARAGEQ